MIDSFDKSPVRLTDNKGERQVICARMTMSIGGIVRHEGCVAAATSIDDKAIQNPIDVYPVSFLANSSSIPRRSMSDLIGKSGVQVDLDAKGLRKHDMYMG